MSAPFPEGTEVTPQPVNLHYYLGAALRLAIELGEWDTADALSRVAAALWQRHAEPGEPFPPDITSAREMIARGRTGAAQ